MKGFVKQRREGGSWTAYWETADPATGKRRQHSKGGFRTKRDAEQHLNVVVGKVQEGSWRRDQPMTVGELLDQWLGAEAASGIRPGTLKMYRDVVNGWIRPHLGGVAVQGLSPAHTKTLVDKLGSPDGSRLGRGPLSPRSIQHAVVALKAATRWGHSSELLVRDPLAGYKRPKAPASSAATDAWSPEEARTFLQSVSDDRLRAAWWLLLGRGLRRGELCGVRWQDVDLDRGVLRIVATRVVVDAKATDSTPKTSAGRRSVPLDAHLVAILRSHRSRQSEHRLAAGAAWQDTGLVFVDEVGRGLRPEYVSRRFTSLVSRAGLRRIRLHDLRHSAASMMLADGTPVKVVSELIGHSNPMITMSVYQHVIPAMGEAAGERLTALLVADDPSGAR